MSVVFYNRTLITLDSLTDQPFYSHFPLRFPDWGNVSISSVNHLNCFTFRRSVQGEPQLEPVRIPHLNFLQFVSQQDVFLSLVGQRRSELCLDTPTPEPRRGDWPG